MLHTVRTHSYTRYIVRWVARNGISLHGGCVFRAGLAYLLASGWRRLRLIVVYVLTACLLEGLFPPPPPHVLLNPSQWHKPEEWERKLPDQNDVVQCCRTHYFFLLKTYSINFIGWLAGWLAGTPYFLTLNLLQCFFGPYFCPIRRSIIKL